MSRPPFIVYALPRSRTNWLSWFLSYGDWKCYHEMSMFMRSADDVRSWFTQENTGTAETAAAPAWRLIRHYRPDLRVVVVRRNVEDVLKSCLAINLDGIAAYDPVRLENILRRVDRDLDRIESSLPGVLSVRFDDLAREDVCARIFEHCLPYQHDHAWWSTLEKMNLQCNSRALLRYRLAHREQTDRLKSALQSELRRIYRRSLDGRMAA